MSERRPDRLEYLEMRHTKISAKLWRQKRELRRLNKHVRVQALGFLHLVEQRREVERRRVEECERAKRIDYRSVCRCRSCRLREWWRFRNGETYLGRPGWRFPWIRKEGV